MRVVFATYCMMNPTGGDSLIGAYKRCLRIGLELHRRGHSVAVLCPGHNSFRDATVNEALGKLTFLEPGFKVYLHSSSRYRRRLLRKAFREFGADIVVSGDAPLGSVMLDATVAAHELGIPSVILDNAYSPWFARKFVRDHSATADGIALFGPASFQMRRPPSHCCSVPPMVRQADEQAAAALDRIWPRARRVVAVLGYEARAEQLALALLVAMPALPCEFVFVTPRAADTEARLAELPPGARAKVRVMPMPEEAFLFEMMRRSQLVIGKSGFNQISECICMGTPFLGVYYHGCCSLWTLPLRALLFVGQTSAPVATFAVRQRFLRLLFTGKAILRAGHRQAGHGLASICDFLERTAGSLRDSATAAAAERGYTVDRVRRALEARHPGRKVDVLSIRATTMRGWSGTSLDCVYVRYRSRGRLAVATLWARRIHSPARDDKPASISAADPRRRIWYRSADERLTLEEELCEFDLPGDHLIGKPVA